MHQREITRAAADIDDEDEPHVAQHLGEPRGVASGEIVEGRLRFLEQREFLQARLARGVHGQRARDFIEGRGDRDDNFLRGQRRVRMRVVPRVREVFEQQRGRRDGRNFFHVRVCAPRKNRRGAIHAFVTEPTLRGRDQAPRHARALPTGEFADDRAGRLAPREPRGTGGKLVFAGQINARRQQRARGAFARAHDLRHGEIHDDGVRAARNFHAREGAIRGAEINADDVAGRFHFCVSARSLMRRPQKAIRARWCGSPAK